MTRKGDYIATYTGKQFYPLDPRPEDVCLEDIAHSLSNLCRFTGHTDTDRFYSVAQHSVICSTIVAPEAALLALLHDAAEAYLGDISRPLKRDLYVFTEPIGLERIRTVEARLQSYRFGTYPHCRSPTAKRHSQGARRRRNPGAMG